MFLGRSFTGHLLTTKGSPLVFDGEDILGWRLPASRLFGAKLLPGSIIASESALHVELHKVRLRKHLRELRLSEFTWMHHVHDTSAAKKKKQKARRLCVKPRLMSESRYSARNCARRRTFPQQCSKMACVARCVLDDYVIQFLRFATLLLPPICLPFRNIAGL